MKINKTLVIALAVLLVAGVLVVVGLNRNSPIPSRAEFENSMSKSTGIGSTASTGDANIRTRKKLRSQKISKDQELLIQYGESRVNEARPIAGALISIFDECVSKLEYHFKPEFPSTITANMDVDSQLKQIDCDFEYTEEQKDKLAKIYFDFQKRQQEKTKDALARLKNDPTPLMNLILANDAKERGEIDARECARLKSKWEKDLEGVPNPLHDEYFDNFGFSHGSVIKDDTFVAEYQSLLTPEQRIKFDESMARTNGTITPKMRCSIFYMARMKLSLLDIKLYQWHFFKE